MLEEKEEIYCMNCAAKKSKQQVVKPNYLFFYIYIYIYISNRIKIIFQLILNV